MRVWVQPRSRRDVEFCASRWLSLLVRPRVPFVHGRSVGQSIIRVIRSIGQSVNRSDGESVELSQVLAVCGISGQGGDRCRDTKRTQSRWLVWVGSIELMALQC